MPIACLESMNYHVLRYVCRSTRPLEPYIKHFHRSCILRFVDLDGNVSAYQDNSRLSHKEMLKQKQQQ